MDYTLLILSLLLFINITLILCVMSIYHAFDELKTECNEHIEKLNGLEEEHGLRVGDDYK